MRIALFLQVFLAVTLCAGAVSAQGGGRIQIYTDEIGTSCELLGGTDVGPVSVFVYHEFHNGVTGARYRIQNCSTTLSYVGEVNYFATIGTALDGVIVTYGECKGTRLPLQEIRLVGTGTSPEGSGFLSRPYPGDDHIFTTTCEGETWVADPEGFCVTGEYGCATPHACGPWRRMCDEPLPVEPATWGKIKMLYQ